MRIVLGTAGHIDHGKTSLVRALTGVDTDRLKEEKERGITIELGFTHLNLPDGTEVGFIDVPGHEKFVRTMIAGAAGIDLVLLVIAADEGVMPQTKEHLEICSLLGVKDGLVVLNKIDAVDADMAALATEEARSAVAGTFLEGRPVVPFSARTGQGKEELLAAIQRAAQGVVERSTRGPFRLSVDRVFSMKGFGTVVTGTGLNGRVQVGEAVLVHPSLLEARVRGLQVHGKEVKEALAGSRIAVNLQGVDREQVPRGSVLAAAGALAPSRILDLEYHHLLSAPRLTGSRVKRARFLAGTVEALGNLILLDGESLEPGQNSLAQLRLEAPVSLRAGDRFVLRSYSPMQTLGGGRVLDSLARKHGRSEPALVGHLKALAGDEPQARALALIEDAGGEGLSLSRLALRLPPGESEEVPAMAKALAKAGSIELLEGTKALTRARYDALAAALPEKLAAFHRAEPAREGMPRAVLLGEALTSLAIGGPEAMTVGESVLRRLETGKKVLAVGGEVRLPSHQPRLDAATSDLRPGVETSYRQAGLAPPTVKELGEKHGPRAREVQAVLAHLLREGVLVRVSQDLYFHREPFEALKERLVGYLEAHSRITPLQFKELAGNISRKFMIPLLEHFDATKLTMRVGEERVLRRKGASG